MVLQPSELLQNIILSYFHVRPCSLLLEACLVGQGKFPPAGRLELMRPHLIKGRKLPRDLEDTGRALWPG